MRAAGGEANVVAPDSPAVALAGRAGRERGTPRAARGAAGRRRRPHGASSDRDSRRPRCRVPCSRRRRSSPCVASRCRFSKRCSAGSARRISFSLPYERQQRAVEPSLLDLVLLRVEVFLAAVCDGDVLEVLVAGVDPVRGRERRREHEPQLEGGPAALLQVLVEDVRRVREEVRAVVRPPTRAAAAGTPSARPSCSSR